MKTFLLTLLLLHSSLSFSHCRDQVYEDLGNRMDQWETRFYGTLGIGPWLVWPISVVTGGAAVVVMVPVIAAIFVTGKVYNNSYLRLNVSDVDVTKIEDAEMKKIIERVFKADFKKLTSETDKNKKAERILQIIAAGNENEELCPKKLVENKNQEITEESEEEEQFKYKYLNLKHVRSYVRARL